MKHQTGEEHLGSISFPNRSPISKYLGGSSDGLFSHCSIKTNVEIVIRFVTIFLQTDKGIGNGYEFSGKRATNQWRDLPG